VNKYAYRIIFLCSGQTHITAYDKNKKIKGFTFYFGKKIKINLYCLAHLEMKKAEIRSQDDDFCVC